MSLKTFPVTRFIDRSAFIDDVWLDSVVSKSASGTRVRDGTYGKISVSSPTVGSVRNFAPTDQEISICRSMSAKPADNYFPRQRPFQNRVIKTHILQRLKCTYKWQKTQKNSLILNQVGKT